MEFHDVLHGRIVIEHPEIEGLVRDLIASSELQRLRNMRQMNFDVPLIQELGRSRRLPHSVGVAYVALELAQKGQLPLKETKELVAAALLHDAAIPPYGHLVETEFKQNGNASFDHAEILTSLISGDFSNRNMYTFILPNRFVEVNKILDRHKVDIDAVLGLVSPKDGNTSPIAADVDLDNIDNVHRMAVMLGWDNAKENIRMVLSGIELKTLDKIRFSDYSEGPIDRWLDFRQRIYTMIIAHPECIPHNALQSDLVELAVDNRVISSDNWYIAEPIFEERLRSNEKTQELAEQLISGCQYQLVDYVWFKNIAPSEKLTNAQVKEHMNRNISFSLSDMGYFVWYEKGLISRKIKWNGIDGSTRRMGEDSRSCMVALIKKTPGGVSRVTEKMKGKWRASVISEFGRLAGTRDFGLAFPEDYSGSYFEMGINEIEFKLQ